MDSTPLRQPFVRAESSYNPDKPFSKKRNQEYPWQLWWCLAVFFFLVSSLQLASHLCNKIAVARSKTRSVGDGEPPGQLSSTRSVWSLRKLPTAVVNGYRVMAFRWTIDFGRGYVLNVAEVVLTIVYIVALFTWSFINTTDVAGNKHANRYWSNRTGTLATSQFPLITALGTKNNLISLSSDRIKQLNYMHRMTSRVTFVLIWVHGIGRIVKGIPAHEWHDSWLWPGILAAVGLTIVCMLSIRPVRAQAYELFFYVHFFLVLAFLIGAYYHARYRHFDPYIIACFIIWGADRLIRVVRLVVFNHSYFGFKSGSGTLDATTELLSPEMVRLVLRRPPHFHWSPGQTAYLIMPGVSALPFEAHPFTIASFDSGSNVEEDFGGAGSFDVKEKESEGSGNDTTYWKELVFLVSPRDGCTRRLLDVAAKRGTIKVFVDGPYGPSPDMRRFDTCVLIAGGSGVSHTLPVLLDIIEKARDEQTHCTRVLFIWAIRELAHINWISEALRRGLLIAPPDLDIDIQVFITRQSSDGMEVENASTNLHPSTPQSDKTVADGNPSVLNMSGIRVASGRPDLKALLQHEVAATQGRMSVSVCGSQSISQTVRSALSFPVSGAPNILGGGASVTLHVESFGYA
ncbi:hypothetical protein PC9H_001799 [Pleurotus ostreatus]|uniref:ferric-chelate reductase (NADPH) n=1 Tax=Pleurotus ostreatus TaxID=5322 RepID=A0A8H7DNL9_PLEOS|nr:uncharacterized protein PC9H_001799 [Pleurotus ostreatus]KAF7419213.1 hypothetical protein PC9H_001799 [Pleurotus ostreatus]